MPIDNPTWEQTTEDQAPSWEDTTEDIAAPAFRPVPPGAIEANINPYERARRILPPGRMTPFGPENPAEILAIPQIASIPGAIATKVEEAVPELGTIRKIFSPREALEKGTEALHEAVAPAVSEFLVRSGIDPSSTPERVINLPRIPAEAFPSIPGLPSPEVAAGVQRLAAGTTEMLAQPENAILALASGGETIVSRAAALMFAAEQFRNLPAELQEAVRVVADPKATIPEKIEAAGRPGVNALLTAGMARAGTRPLPRIRPPIETAGVSIPQINLEQPPLALYGSELAGRPRGAVPVQPIAGPEVLGPPAPRRVRAPEIPAAGTAERLTQEQQVREANARTKEQIRALFPDLSREEAATLRDRAWGVAGETGVFPGEMATLRAQIPEAVRRRFFRTEGEETLEGLRALAGLPGRRVAAPPAPAADLPADAAAQFAKETGWTVTRGQAGAGVKMPTAAELEKLPESERALYQQMADAQGAPVEYTDRRPGSPTQGFTFYAPKDASLADIRAAHAAKLAEVKAGQKPAAAKPEVAFMGPESNAEVKDAHGNPLGTYYYGTAEDWLAWKNLQKQKAAAIAARDMGALEKLLLENERLKNLYGGNPPLPPKGTKIVAAAYFPKGATAPETGPNHPAILKRLGVSGFETPESRNTPEFGYVLSDGSFITREEAGPISKASKQNLVDFDAGENVHSDEVASPTEPDKPLGEAKPADIGARVIAGKTLAEWEAVKDASGLPKGKGLAELAKFLNVPAKPGRVLAALANKTRTREYYAPPPTVPPPAPPQEPPAAAPVPVPKPPSPPAAPAAAVPGKLDTKQQIAEKFISEGLSSEDALALITGDKTPREVAEAWIDERTAQGEMEELTPAEFDVNLQETIKRFRQILEGIDPDVGFFPTPHREIPRPTAPAAPAAAAETPPPPAAPAVPPGELLAVPPVATPTANQQRGQIVRLLEQLEEEDNLGEISMRELETDAWESMSKAIATTLGRSWGDVLNMEQEAAIKALRTRLGEIEKAKREGREPSEVPSAPPQPANASVARIQSAFDDWDAGKEGANSVDLLDKVENEISDFPDNVPQPLQDAARKYREAVEESYEEGAKLEGAFIAEVAKASGRPVPPDVVETKPAAPATPTPLPETKPAPAATKPALPETAAGERDLAQQIDVALQRQLQGQKPPPPAPAAAPAPTPPPISQAPITEASAVTDLRPALRGAKIPPDLQAMIDRRNQLREQMDAQVLKIEGNKARGAKAEPNSAEWEAAYKEAQEIDAQTDKIRGELAPLESKVWDQLWEMEKAAVRGLPVPPPRTPQVTAKVLKAQRENLLAQLDDAIKGAPEGGEEKIQISVPGDGDFTLNNNKEALRKFKGIVQKEFPTAVPTGKGPSVPSGKARALPKAAEPTANELPKIVGAFVSEDPSRFVLQTMYADGTQIIATDGRRLMRVVTAAAPGTPAEPVRVTPEGKIDVDANEANFPNYNQVKPTDPTLVKGGFNIEDLWKIGRQAQALLKDGKTDAVSLYLNKDGSFGGKASNAGVGDFEHNVQPDAFFLGNVNANYLVEGLEAGRRLGNEKLDLYVEGDAGPFVFVGKNHDYTLMGMKAEGMPEGVARDDPKKLRPAAVGQKVFALQPAGLGPLKNPEAPNSQMIGTDQGNFRVSYKNGELSIEKVPIETRGYAAPIDAGTYPIDKAKAVAPTVQEIQAKSGDFLEQKFTGKTLNALRKGMESLLKEREALIEEGKTRLAASKPSLGPGAAAAAEFSDGPPDHEVLGQQIGSPAWNRITRLFRNFFLGFEQLYERGGQKTDLMMLANAADNLPRIAGLNAGEKLRLRTSADQRQAITFVMQSLKMSGEGIPADAAARLGQLEFAGDPIGYLRAKQADMETAAQAFNNRGEKIEAKAALDAAKAMFFARQHFNELRPLAERAKRIFDSQLMRERIAGIDTDYERWYVPQRHELDLITSTDRPIVLGHSRAGGLSSAFKKAKVYEDYASAIEDGFVPRSLDIADLVEHRVNQGERLVERKAFFNKMRQMTDPVDGKALAIKIPRKIIHRPDGSFDVQESVPLGYRMQDVIPGVRIAVHDGYARLIRAMTASSQIADSAAIGTLQDIAAFEKHIGLALDTFHASRTMQAELALTGKVSIGARQRLGRALVEYAAADLDAAVSKGEITQEMADWIRRPQPMEVNGRQISLTPKSVFTLGLNNGLNVARFADAIYRDWLRKVPISGTVNKWVFDKMTRSAIAHGFIVEFERVAKANPQLDATRVARNVARDINVMFGNLQKESIFRNPSLRSINQILFLAPTWVEAVARREARFGIQMAKLPLQLARGEPLSVGTVGRGVGTGLAAYFVATQVLNLITRHQLTFYNDERGHKLDAWIPDVTGKTGGFFISPLSVFAEITHDILRYAETKPDLATALQQIGTNKLGNLGRFMEVITMGRDPLTGDKIIGTGRRALAAAIQAVPVPISLSQLSRGAVAAAAPGLVTPPPAGAIQRQVTASMGFKTEPVPTAGQQVYQLADKWKSESGDPKLVDEVTRRLQQDFGPSDYKPLRNALQTGDLAGARRAYDELRKSKSAVQIRQTMQHPHPFTGSAANERKFKASLAPAEREIYDKALQERRELYRRYRQMLYSNR